MLYPHGPVDIRAPQALASPPVASKGKRSMRETALVTAASPAPPTAPAGVHLRLLDGFELRCNGEPVALPPSAQRVMAFMALHDRALQRLHVAAMLWLDASEDRASANLRSALWRLHKGGHELVEATNRHLRLASAVRVDYRETTALAQRLVSAPGDVTLDTENNASLGGDLLPDWYDDWVLLERERFRQLRLHALEALCDRLLAAGRFGEALEAGLAAVIAEPLRESAHRALIRLHLAEGNQVEAVRQYRFFRDLLRDELGLEPSPQMGELVVGLTR